MRWRRARDFIGPAPPAICFRPLPIAGDSRRAIVQCSAGNVALARMREVPHTRLARRAPHLPTPRSQYLEPTMSKDEATIVIAAAARTPVGSFNGALASL